LALHGGQALDRAQVAGIVHLVSPASEGIRRLTVAVVVNHRATTNPKGQVQPLPLPPAEIDKLLALIQARWASVRCVVIRSR
jgi:flagellar M-ring protein FliF